VDQDCIKLTSYLSERHRIGSRLTDDGLAGPDGLDGTGEIAASILLRGTDGSGLRLHLRTGCPRVEAVSGRDLRLSYSRLVTLERTRLLSEEIDPVGLWDDAGQATRLTVYCRRQDRIYQVPAFEVICELLHRRGMTGATVLAAADGTTMVIAVGSGQRLGLVLPEIGGLLRHPLITLEQVRVCKRDGQLVGPPQAVPGTDTDGRPLWQKLTVYACDSARHHGRSLYRGQSLHQAISGRLHAVGISDVTVLRGRWGFHGDRAPHGGRHVPGVTIVVDRPERMPAAFAVIDKLTTGRGLVTSEMVTAVHAAQTAPSR
jgi:PII-like signaling protein